MAFSFNGIKAVVFDLDGTLRHNQPESTSFFMDLAVRLGAPDGPERRHRLAKWTHYYWAQSPELSQDMQIYTTLSEGFWQRYASRALVEFGCEVEQAVALAPILQCRMEKEYQPQDYVPPEAPATLEALRQAGYSLAVLSNRSTPFQDYITSLGLEGFFQVILAAGEIGAWKPDPAAFQPVLERLGCSPAQAVYVGDNYYADIVGARQAGMTPILIDPEGIFEDPGCSVIQHIEALPALLAPSTHEQRP